MKTTKERIFWGAALVFIACSIYFFLGINGLAYQKKLSKTPQAQITLIPGAMIPTVDESFLIIETATPTYDPSTMNGSEIVEGMYVQITGTEGSGLNIRNGPKLSEGTIFVANDSEVFQIIDGPIESDGYQWWLLSAPYDQSRQGWAVQDYLRIIQP